MQDLVVRLVSPLVLTFVGAWAGAWAAFMSERKTQESNRRAERISAANKAIFTIRALYETYENLRQHYIDVDEIRDDPDRALRMDSPQSGMMRNIEFNFNELHFFLDHPGEVRSTVLMELLRLEREYHILLQTVEHHARADDEFGRMRSGANIVTKDEEKFDTAEKTTYSAQYSKLEATTNQMIASVDAGITRSREVYEKVQSALQQQFPGQKFLTIPFNE
ncbi:MAG TPA: hypothetical protein DEP05_06205 [Betaproteobacteria bacterium]|nr:hypothetical protein [Betaproteobacteria bacterium]